MSVSMRLQVRQAQSLALTPQLLQSIRLLQFSHHDLGDFVRREADRNPLISLPERGAARSGLSGARRGASSGARTQERSAAAWSEDLPEGPASLAAHALREIAEAFPQPRERRIAEALLLDLDEAGYLRVDAPAAAAALGVAPQAIAAILRTLRSRAEPAGLFAGDLAECLSLQLARRGRLDAVMETVLGRLDLVARRDFKALSRLTGEDEAGLAQILSQLRGLDPRPGASFEASPCETVVPDVTVAAHPDGGWRVSLNPDALPKVLVDEDYAQTLAAGCASEAERAFVKDCRASATWLQRSLDQRARSILKVASQIMRRQEGFLTHGVGAVRPMTLAAVAEAVGLHESTVSRVTANKYVQTPCGTFELKFFFTAAIAATDGGDAHSATGVKHRIHRLVAAEGPGSVLSDDAIAARLRAEGIDVARRTVAKYREALGIASSAQRRRELQARRIAS